MIYFTSDTHFWHRAIIQYCNRPWSTPEEMNEGLIERWNAKVKPTDTIYHLGDFCFGGIQKSQEVFDRLNGLKYLIAGNHDNWKTHSKLGWQGMYDYYTLKANLTFEGDDGNLYQTPQQIILMHFPILSWENMHHGSWHLHGHCHGSLPDAGCHRVDVGVDTNKWEPYSLDDVQEKMIKRQFVRVDHHG